MVAIATIAWGAGSTATTKSATTKAAATKSAATTKPAASTGSCTLSAALVPACGVLQGVAPGQFVNPGAQALATYEQTVGQHMDIYHAYHVAPQLFPTKPEIGIANQAGKHRLLLENWKPENGHTWAQVANGASDSVIDKEAAYLKSTYTNKFYLAIHHEPENDVNASPGSGNTASDYRAMFRHVVQRLRGDGVHNAVTVVDYMGDPDWSSKPWFNDLYPGDDVVDWIAEDPYACVRAGKCGDFAGMVNRKYGAKSPWPGFYTWATTKHPSKPIMVAEWGAFEHSETPNDKPAFFKSAMSELANFPKIKAVVYFDSPHAPRGDTQVNSSPSALSAFRQLVDLPSLLQVILP